MSWTFRLAFCATKTARPLIEECTLDPECAGRVLGNFGFNVVSRETAILNDALGLEPKHIAVGAYNNSDMVIFSDPYWLLGNEHDEIHARLRNVDSIPTERVLCTDLAGITGFHSYSYWAGDRLIRRFSADGDHRVIDSFGGFLPVETELFKSVRKDDGGFRFKLTGNDENELCEYEIGGALTFAMMSMFLGVTYTSWSGEEPEIFIYRVRYPSNVWAKVRSFFQHGGTR